MIRTIAIAAGFMLALSIIGIFTIAARVTIDAVTAQAQQERF